MCQLITDNNAKSATCVLQIRLVNVLIDSESELNIEL